MKKGVIKNISLIVLLLSFILIVYLLIKEQFRGKVLSATENIILSVTYLLIAAALIILFRIQNIEKKSRENLKK